MARVQVLAPDPAPLVERLAEHGHAVVSEAPEVVLADGVERMPEPGAAPVVVVTRDVERALARGAHDVIGDFAELDARVRAAARVKALGDELRQAGRRALERLVALAVRHGHAGAIVRVEPDGSAPPDAAERLSAALRGGDELAPWGGGFLALLPDTDRAGALRAAERLRAAVAPASAGWAHWAGDTPDDLVARADRALEHARAAGGDAVRPER